LSLREAADGRVLLHCHAGCNVAAITAALGIAISDLFPSGNGKRRIQVATYDYVNEAGELLFQVVRFEPKTFRQRRPDGQGGWVWNLGESTRRVLYRLPEILESVKTGQTIYVVEGEKDVASLVGWGLAATCNPGGAGKWRPHYGEVLRGSRVVVIADADKPGRDHAAAVAASLKGVAAEIRVVELPGAKDVTAWAAAGGTCEGLEALWGVYTPHQVEVSTKEHDPPAGDAEILSDAEPWPDPVDGVTVLNEVVATLMRFVALSPGEVEAVALWIAHAHAIDAASVSPLLAVLSPQKRCGKSTLHAVIRYLVPRPLPTSNISPAALFRAVEKFQPTLLVDEVDSFLRDNDDLRGILNSGHLRTSATVIRCEGDAHEVTTFATWAAKALACIGRLPETLEDRSIVVSMHRAMKGEVPERLRLDRLGQLEPVRRRLDRWAGDHLDALRAADPAMPAALTSDRACDNWRALLAIADEAGGTWPDRARKAACLLSGVGETEDSIAVRLLADIKMLFDERGAARLASSEIVGALVEMEDRPWPEWREGRAITGPGVARLLKPFGIHPGQWRAGSKPARGYLAANFEEAWMRYLPLPSPPLDSGHSVQDSRESTSGTTYSGHCPESVPSTTSRKSNDLNDVPSVPSTSTPRRDRKLAEDNDLVSEIEL
jgi:hypothetical protein